MSVEQMRANLMTLYSMSWRNKVKLMSDSQVIAVYKSFQLRGKIKC